MVINNGGGGPQANAKVDINGRLHVLSVSEGFNIEAAILGDNYNINTGPVSLTSANKSAIMYMRNNDDKPFVIEDILIIHGASLGGSGDLVVEVIQNPSAGTIVSNAVTVDTVANRNFGKTSKTLDADVFVGVEGDTLTSGTLFADTSRTGPGVIEFDADVIILEKGSSIGVNFTPQAGNSLTSVRVAIVGYLIDTKVTS